MLLIPARADVAASLSCIGVHSLTYITNVYSSLYLCAYWQANRGRSWLLCCTGILDPHSNEHLIRTMSLQRKVGSLPFPPYTPAAIVHSRQMKYYGSEEYEVIFPGTHLLTGYLLARISPGQTASQDPVLQAPLFPNTEDTT